MTIEQIIAEIRQVLQSDGVIAEDRVFRIALAYDEECAGVNERLQACGALLRKGLRSEAIHQAELPPNVLEAAALLDFAEREDWVQLLQDIGATSPAQIDVDTATALNEAYAKEEELRKLLTRHRRLALARAALPDRLQVLRALVEQDPTNVVWQDDVRHWEQTRFQQMSQAGGQAYKRGDHAALVELGEQLRNTPWQETPPPSLVSNLMTAEDKLTRRWARQQLKELEPKFNAAYSALDLDEGRRLRSQWSEFEATAQLNDDDELLELVAPAMEWLAEEDERTRQARAHQAAIANLESALEKNLARAELERRYHAAENFDADVPELLRERYRARIASLELASRRKFSLAVAAVVVVLGLCAYGSWHLITSSQYAEAVQHNLTAIATMLDQGQLTEARAFVDELGEEQADVAASPQIRELIVQLETAEKTEADRKTRFRRALTMGQGGESSNDRRAALNEARGLATTDEEKAQVARAQQELQQQVAAEQREIDEAFSASLTVYMTRFDELDEDGESFLTDARQLLEDVKTFVANSPAVRIGVRNTAEPLEDRLEAMIAAEEALAAEIAALDKVIRAAGSAEIFQQELASFTKDFPGSSRTLDMQAVIEDVDLWKGLLAWSELAKEWDSQSRLDLSPSAADSWGEEFDELLTSEHGEFPYGPAAEQKRAVLLEIVKRDELAASRELSNFRGQFRDQLFADVSLIIAADEERHYLKLSSEKLEELKQDQSSAFVAVFQDIAGNTRNESLRTLLSASSYDGPSPQSEMAEELYRLLGEGLAENWDHNFLQLITIVRNQERLDPILRISLLRDFIYLANEGNSNFDIAFRTWSREFETDIDLTVQWIRPGDEAAAIARSRANKSLADLRDLGDIIANFQQANRKALQEFSADNERLAAYKWHGTLLRHLSGGWYVAGDDPPQEPGTLSIVAKDASGEVVIQDIGTCAAGEFQINTTTPARLREGLPVFIRSQ